MRRIIWSTLAVIVLSAWMGGVRSLALPVKGGVPSSSRDGLAAAQESSLTMQVTVGFDGYCRGDGWCLVYVVLSNEGTDIEGELRVAVRGAGAGTEPNVYARQAVLPVHSRKAYFLYFSSAGSSSRSDLTVQLLAGDKVLLSEQVKVAWLDEGDPLYGVVSSSPSALNFLSGVTPTGGDAKVAHLSIESLPPDPLGWEGLDVLVLNDVDTSALSAEQRQALETWIAHGGHLIVGGGAGVSRTMAGLADPSTALLQGSGQRLLPVTVGGTLSVDDLWALGEYLAAPIAAGPYLVAEATLQDGEALIEQGDLILLARRTYGAGVVVFLAFDAGLNPFTRWDDNARLWELIVGTGTAGSQRLTVHNGYSAHQAINAIPGLELPSTLQILAFMLVYTLLIGPVNYVILRKLDRRELAWLTIPALIVGFTVCAYVTGFQLRGNRAIVHRLAAVYVPVLKAEGPEGPRTGRVSQLVGLFSPRRTTYDVHVAGARVCEIPGDYFYGRPAAQPLYVVEKVEGATAVGLRVDVGGIQPFTAEGYVDVPVIEADLWLVEETTGKLQLEGTVHNGSVPLKEAVLIVGGDEQRLGDLEAGEEASIALPLDSHVQPNLPEQILGPGNYWGDRVLHRRHQFLQALFPYEGSSLGKGAHLVGWVEEKVPLPVEVVNRPFSTVEMALYIYELPVASLEPETSILISPKLITRQIEETAGHVDIQDDYILIAYEASAVFRFTVWPEATIRRVDLLSLSLLQNTRAASNHLPQLALWNWEAGKWESQAVGWGDNVIPDPGRYVRLDGTVRVRLEADTAQHAELKAVTITIEGQR